MSRRVYGTQAEAKTALTAEQLRQLVIELLGVMPQVLFRYVPS